MSMIIDNILDNYMSNSIINLTKNIIFNLYNLDFKVIKRKNDIDIYCKYKEFKESEYRMIYTFNKARAIFIIGTFDHYTEDLKNSINEYCKIYHI